jgi:preprotein translocase subunit SecD
MKNTGLWIRTAIIIAITLAGIYLVFGPRRTPNANDLTWEGMKANLAENINLGLDLKGGSHLVMRVRTDDYLKKVAENNAQAAMTAAQDAKLPVTGDAITAEGKNYSVRLDLSDPSQAQAVSCNR